MLKPCTLCMTLSDRLICDCCLNSLPRMQAHCTRCSIPLFENAPLNSRPPAKTDHQEVSEILNLICGQCLKHPPPFSYTRCAWQYAYPMNYLIHQFKSAGNHALGQFLSSEMACYLRQGSDQLPWPDALIPIPLHWQKRWQRGFNQSDVIGQTLSKQLRLAYRPELIKRHRTSTPQRKLNAKQRFQSLKGKFYVKSNLQHMHIALIDDVITTTATTHWATMSLLEAGAESVQVWALARTPQPYK